MLSFLLHAKKISLLFLILSILAVVQSGCWDRVEIEDLGIVLGTGLDKGEDNQIRLIVQLAVPTEMGGGPQQVGRGKKPTFTVIGTGETVYDALVDVQRQFSDRIFFGHNRVLIIDEELAKEGIAEYIDFFVQHPQPRLRALVIVSKNAEEALKTETSKDLSSSQALEEIVQLLKSGIRITLKDVFQMLRQEGESVVLPWVQASDNEGEQENVQVNGAAIFDGDQLIGTIDFELKKGLLWLRDEMDLQSISVNPEEADGYITFHLIRSKTKLLPSIEGGNWKITVEIEQENEIVENQTTLDTSTEKVKRELEKDLNKTVEQQIRKTLEKVQKEMKTDAFGFAEAFERKYPKRFAQEKDHWDEIYPEVEVEINVTSRIRRIGMTTNQVGKLPKEVKEE